MPNFVIQTDDLSKFQLQDIYFKNRLKEIANTEFFIQKIQDFTRFESVAITKH